jgi:hypothetical protein
VVRPHPNGDESGLMRERLELTISSALANSVLELINERFDDVEARPGPGTSTIVTAVGIDQAGERALLNLLWDTGHDIGSLS